MSISAFQQTPFPSHTVSSMHMSEIDVYGPSVFLCCHTQSCLCTDSDGPWQWDASGQPAQPTTYCQLIATGNVSLHRRAKEAVAGYGVMDWQYLQIFHHEVQWAMLTRQTFYVYSRWSPLLWNLGIPYGAAVTRSSCRCTFGIRIIWWYLSTDRSVMH